MYTSTLKALKALLVEQAQSSDPSTLADFVMTAQVPKVLQPTLRDLQTVVKRFRIMYLTRP